MTWGLMLPLVALVVGVGALFGVLVLVFDQFNDPDGNGGSAFLPENNLPVALIVAVVALLLAIAVLAIVYARLGLQNRESPLGLPEGSVRAMIALLLIVLFFVTSIFLYADSSRRSLRRLEGLTAEQVEALPPADLRGRPVPQEQEPATAPGEEPAPERFDVTIIDEKPEASQDIAKQLVTTVSTLVVAVAAFYFGANSVQTAARVSFADGNGPPSGAWGGELPLAGGGAEGAVRTTPAKATPDEKAGAPTDPPSGGARASRTAPSMRRSRSIPPAG